MVLQGERGRDGQRGWRSQLLVYVGMGETSSGEVLAHFTLFLSPDAKVLCLPVCA